MLIADNKLLEEYEISLSDLLLLQDLNLLNPNIIQIYYKKVEKETTSNLIHGNNLIQVSRDNTSPNVNLQVYKFTTVGRELLKLVDVPLNESYIQEIAKKIKTHESIKVSTCTMFDNNKQYRPNELTEV